MSGMGNSIDIIFFVAWGILGLSVMYLLVLPMIRDEVRLAGYERRAAAAAQYNQVAKARGRVVVAGNVHCSCGCIFPDGGRIRCASCGEEESRQKE